MAINAFLERYSGPNTLLYTRLVFQKPWSFMNMGTSSIKAKSSLKKKYKKKIELKVLLTHELHYSSFPCNALTFLWCYYWVLAEFLDGLPLWTTASIHLETILSLHPLLHPLSKMPASIFPAVVGPDVGWLIFCGGKLLVWLGFLLMD